MFRHLPALPLALMGLAGLAACSGGATAPAPVTTAAAPLPAPSLTVPLGGVAARGDTLTSALGVYTLTIDPGSLTATAEVRQLRTSQANDDLYLLPIDSFLRPDSFRVTSVKGTSETLEIGYAIRHPFLAPSDPAGTPNGSSNRADLGITGMALFLTDVIDAAGNTYFDEGPAGAVIVDTAMVANPDAYFRPAGLLDLGTAATAFPYRRLVDETADPRVGAVTGSPISNGGSPTGNFGIDGWTRSELGTTRDGWTGYGFLHQGQEAAGMVALDRDALDDRLFLLDVAIIAKYQDPRGGLNAAERKANRLPPATPDSTKFAYRGNHGALDVEALSFRGESGGFIPNQLSASTLTFHVLDCDARAAETSEADLADEPDVTKVASGESGLPALAVCIPGVLGDAAAIDTWDPAATITDDDAAAGGDLDADSGQPGDPLYFTKAVTKLVLSGQTNGTYAGLVRATDPEAALEPPLVIALNGGLQPLSANVPEPVTYQVFTVTMATPNDPPSVTVQGPAGVVQSATSPTFQVTAYGDPNGDTVQLQFDWNNDGDFADTGEAFQTLTGPAPLNFPSPLTYNNSTTTNEMRNVPYRYTDGVIAAPLAGTGSFTLGPNRSPVRNSGTFTLASGSASSPATFQAITSALNVSDPEGDPISFTVVGTPNGGASPVTATGTAFPINVGPFTNPPSTLAIFTAFINDPAHPTTSGTSLPGLPSPVGGAINPPPCGLSMNTVDTTLATLTSGNVLRGGTGPNQPITGVQVGWTDIAGEAEYAIQRALWSPGSPLGSISFSTIGTAPANATTYNDTSIVASGSRYLYRVAARCTVGGSNGSGSRFAMVVLQNFESAPLNGAAVPDTVGLNGWLFNYPSSLGGQILTYSGTAPLNGFRDFRALEFGFVSTASNTSAFVLSPPQFTERLTFGPLTVSRFELVHSYAHGGNADTGYAILTNTARPMNSGFPTPNNWQCMTSVPSGFAYNDSSSFAFSTIWFSNIGIPAVPWNWGNPGGVIGETFSQVDTSPGTLTAGHDFVFVAFCSFPTGGNEDVRIDDLAWIVY